MAPRGNKGSTPAARTGSNSIGRDIALAEMKLECLLGLGVDVAPLEKKLTQSKKSLRNRDYEGAAKRLEEILLFFSLVGEELNDILARFQGSRAGGRTAREALKRDDPTLNEIEDVVEDAFQKALHSKGLRRMVEVIALEKVRLVLEGEGVPPAWIRSAVEEALRKKSPPKTSRGKRA